VTSVPERVPVLLIHADAEVRRWVAQALPDTEFTVTAYSAAPATPRAALGEQKPRVILLDATWALADQRLCQALHEGDPPAVLIALAAPNPNLPVSQLFDSGLDDVLVLPLDGVALRAKVRASLRLLNLALATRQVHGALGPEGVLPLIKHCEDHRLSGRLTVESSAQRHWLDFFGGELLGTGSDAAAGDGDDLAALMSLREGSYVFVQAAVEPLAPTQPASGPEPPSADSASTAALQPPETIVTVFQATQQHPGYEVRTSGDNRPAFTITTTVVQDGRLLRETETDWPHPIESETDLAQARVQMGQQHERVSAKLREVAEPRPGATAAMSSGVDGTLLSWAMHFVVEQAWADLGTTVTANLLGRTQSALRHTWPHLAHFRIGDKAQVTFDLSHGATLASDAVQAVAGWLAAFLYLARRVAPDLTQIEVQKSTLLMASALERVGFYAAFASATADCERDGVQLGGTSVERAPLLARPGYALASGANERATRSNNS
jgi:CheY-like chemotaxis protein